MGLPFHAWNKTLVEAVADGEGISLIEYLKKGEKISGEYYPNFFDQLERKICETIAGLQKKLILFYQDKAQTHKGTLRMGKLSDFFFRTFI